MSRTRFKALMAMLHVVNPANEDKSHKLRKVESFINDFKSRCLALYQPRQNLAIDERMVKSRHRSGIRQYIKDKPTRWGIKLWVLADSSNGYTVDFNVYIGKAAGQRIGEFGLGYDVVMRLMRPFLHQGYHLYVDNFYTSLPLFKDLFAQGVPATGTISEKRRGFPDALKKDVPWVPPKKIRGAMRWVRDPPCLVLQWVDSKVVSLLSTIESANDYGFVDRKRKEVNVWAIREVKQPKVIANYNKYMNGVNIENELWLADVRFGGTNVTILQMKGLEDNQVHQNRTGRIHRIGDQFIFEQMVKTIVRRTRHHKLSFIIDGFGTEARPRAEFTSVYSPE